MASTTIATSNPGACTHGFIKASCSDCNLKGLCLPIAMDIGDIDRVDKIIQRSRPLHAGDHLYRTGEELELAIVNRGTYVVMEGPQFSSLAESELHRGWHADVIGMTNMPEAKLAREAELCYATVAMVTDFDCWHPDHEHVQVSDVIKVMHENAGNAKKLLAHVIPKLESDPCPHGCDRALEHAILTAREAIDPVVAKKLDAVAGRVLGR